MPLRLSNLRLGIDESEEALPDEIGRALGVRADDLPHWRILRKSLDARDQHDLAFVYSVEVTTPAETASLIQRVRRRRPELRADEFAEPVFVMPAPGTAPLEHRPIIVGSGPAGLAGAYFLAQQGYRPLVLERGRAVRERIHDVAAFDAGGPHDPESNYLFGEGGAGTFSDGKLTCRGSGPDVRRILELFAECKGKPSIVYDARPHLGSNRLPAVVKALRQRIEALGGELRFSCRVEDLDIADGRIKGVATSSGYLPATVVILAIGHSARDTYEMLHRRGVPMEQKPFQLGVRIEQPQDQVNRVKYGNARLEERLGAADYTLIAHTGNRAQPLDLFTFCMCAGGYVMPSVSEPGYFCTNGMSLSRHDSPFANSGLVVTLDPSRFGSPHVLAGVELQRRFERKAFELSRADYRCPLQLASDFLARRRTRHEAPSSYPRGVVLADLHELVPAAVSAALHEGLPMLDRRWRGRFLANATLVGPEARGSAPVRIPRVPASRESPTVKGLYPIGEGAGYAGGIVSAAVDGLRTAQSVIACYAPLESAPART
jgi:uncharacterized FAD-dependent dehydrogenase